ncbi:UNVERIFIED_CONTAM: hypothetical protein Scaly_2259500 [Sesamum calycinum]|uniref:RNase H type-1 domain-containing protein n=1 Tax=Sesamum calycinum TaxID=2727403 RepID=A0AAW2MBM2_9LAMI
MAIKLDIRKAYDKGDPFSPYLFLLCTDALTSLISKAEHCGDLRGNSSYWPSLRLDPLPHPTTVDHLCTAEGGDWNVPLIESIFSAHDVQAILSIPIGRTDSFTEITVAIPSFNTTTVFALWRPPENGFVKINYDTALFLDTGDFGICVIARDHKGNCLAWLSQRLHRTISPELAEAWAARATIDLGIRFKWDKIIIEGDCANLGKQLVDRKGYSSSMEVLIHDIFALCPRFLSCSFSLVRRQGNCVAHSAVNFAEGLTDLPNYCTDAILADLPN